MTWDRAEGLDRRDYSSVSTGLHAAYGEGRVHLRAGYLPVRGEGVFVLLLAAEPGGVVMDVVEDPGWGIGLDGADRPLVLGEQLELLEQRQQAGATDSELRGLVAELRQLQQGW